MKTIVYLIVIFCLTGCSNQDINSSSELEVFLVVLGIAQDAGYPQAGCNKSCCKPVWEGDVQPEKVISLGLVDRPNNKVYLFDATPDFKEQLQILLAYLPAADISSVGGIFLTHAHIGHYTGLMHLGREVMGTSDVPVFVMPKMKRYLTGNGPWSQLVKLNNIKLIRQKADSIMHLARNITVMPFLVPHRDEYSETVGYKIIANDKRVLFIPDIDKWHKWQRNIISEVEQVDFAFLDGAFNSEEELPNRDMSEIPHPFVPETIEIFKDSPPSTKSKIIFIHFNHTNPLLHNGPAYSDVLAKGFNIGREGTIYNLE